MSTARELTDHLARLLREEQGAMADFLLALADFDRRKLWRELGHTSLFYYLHRELSRVTLCSPDQMPGRRSVRASCSSARLRGRRSTTARTPIATRSDESAAAEICHGAPGMTWEAGSTPSRMRRSTEPTQIPRRRAVSSRLTVSWRG